MRSLLPRLLRLVRAGSSTAAVWLASLGVLTALATAVVFLTNRQEIRPFFQGEKVLANCREVYLLGTIEKVRALGYNVYFGPETQPILCPNYLWKGEFLENYEPIARIEFEGQTWRIGDQVEVKVLVEGKTFPLRARIASLTQSRKIKLFELQGKTEALIAWQNSVGQNYLPLGAFKMRKLP